MARYALPPTHYPPRAAAPVDDVEVVALLALRDDGLALLQRHLLHAQHHRLELRRVERLEEQVAAHRALDVRRGRLVLGHHLVP